MQYQFILKTRTFQITPTLRIIMRIIMILTMAPVKGTNSNPQLAWQFTCDSSRQIFAAGHHQWKYLKRMDDRSLVDGLFNFSTT